MSKKTAVVGKPGVFVARSSSSIFQTVATKKSSA